MTERKKISAVGHEGVNAGPGDKAIERLMAKRAATAAPVKLGYGRVITTVDSMPEIKKKLGQGYEILWCQLSKIISADKTGEIDG